MTKYIDKLADASERELLVALAKLWAKGLGCGLLIGALGMVAIWAVMR